MPLDELSWAEHQRTRGELNSVMSSVLFGTARGGQAMGYQAGMPPSAAGPYASQPVPPPMQRQPPQAYLQGPPQQPYAPGPVSPPASAWDHPLDRPPLRCRRPTRRGSCRFSSQCPCRFRSEAETTSARRATCSTSGRRAPALWARRARRAARTRRRRSRSRGRAPRTRRTGSPAGTRTWTPRATRWRASRSRRARGAPPALQTISARATEARARRARRHAAARSAAALVEGEASEGAKGEPNTGARERTGGLQDAAGPELAAHSDRKRSREWVQRRDEHRHPKELPPPGNGNSSFGRDWTRASGRAWTTRQCSWAEAPDGAPAPGSTRRTAVDTIQARRWRRLAGAARAARPRRATSPCAPRPPPTSWPTHSSARVPMETPIYKRRFLPQFSFLTICSRLYSYRSIIALIQLLIQSISYVRVLYTHTNKLWYTQILYCTVHTVQYSIRGVQYSCSLLQVF